MTRLILSLLLIGSMAAASNWSCEEISSSAPNYHSFLCKGSTPHGIVGPLGVHVVRVPLSGTQLQLVPVAAPGATLATVPNLAKMQGPNAVASINGGYFWRIDLEHFVDDVCFFKSRADALKNVSNLHPNWGIGDSLMRRNGVLYSSNCDLLGNGSPAALIFNGTNSSIVVLDRGQNLPASVNDCIGAGPSLVLDGEVDIRGFNVNIWSLKPATAVGLIGVPGNFSEAILVVTDGHDGCKNTTCGVNCHQLAYMMRDQFGVHSAMAFDQGGSATMWIDSLGVVSSNRNNPRHVFNAIVVVNNTKF